MTQQYNEQVQNLINQQYKVWKKNAPYLYDLLIAHQLQDWYSLTAQWLPNKDQTDDRSIHRVILGTMADQNSLNYLMVVKVFMPTQKQQEQKQSYGQIKSQNPRVQIQTKIIHDGEINRARYCPHRYNLIATKTKSGQVHLFDYAKRSSKPSKTQSQPDLKLIGHDKQGYGISWNQRKQGLLLSGGYDQKILIWDVQSGTQQNRRINPIYQLKFHNGDVQDVAWHPMHPDIFGSVGGDRNFALWDLRTNSPIITQYKNKPLLSSLCHTGQIYSLDWNPFNQYLYLTGADDREIGLWDLRNPTKRIHTMNSHTNQVLKVQWSPHHQCIFASSSADRKIIVWDLSRIGQKSQHLEHPAQILFIHAGHRSKVTDFDWNLNQKLGIVSTQETNIFQVWEMSRSIYYQDR